MNEKLLVFPNITPSSIRRSLSYELIDGDLQDSDDLEVLAERMFYEPGASFYFYIREGEPPPPILRGSADISCDETEFFFYQLFSDRDFVRIFPRPEGQFKWDWQQEYVKTRPQFMRHRLKLSDRKRRQFEKLERIHLDEQLRGRTTELVMGDKYEVSGSQVGAVGPGTTVNGISFGQIWSQSQAVDLAKLEQELSSLGQAMAQNVATAEHDAALAAIVSAQEEAKNGRGPEALEYLSKAGNWVLEVASKIGAETVAAVLKSRAGL